MQVQMGGCAVDLSGAALASLLDPTHLLHAHSLSSSSVLVLDLWSEFFLPLRLRESHYDSDVLVGSRSGSRVREEAHRLINVENWRSILEYVMPKVVSVNLRSSRIQGSSARPLSM